MLVLTRRAGERISIGDNIEIVVRRVTGNRVTLGVEAPRDIRILRSELDQFAGQFDGSAADKEFSEHPPSGEEPYVVVQGHIPRVAIPAVADMTVG